MRIAVITGAAGGIGKEFTRQILKEKLDEIWVVGRNRENLEKLRREFGNKIIPIAKDLSLRHEIDSIGRMCEERKVCIAYLVNNAGTAKMGAFEEFDSEEIERSVAVNCGALPLLCTACIPYMKKGSRIINLSSAASFQPMPYLNLYAAEKVFERYYSRALHIELMELGITVTAVCPGWVDTELLMKECNGRPVKFHGLISAEQVAVTAIADAKAGKDLSVSSPFAKYLYFLSKILPERTMMMLWQKQLEPYGFRKRSGRKN